ncbi:CgeB family protein [Ferdinandcohnia sp. SAFN-114]|uniref:CgeB family protein n=1 Tax=Ferdinandcohnia sp. SAFN-114 TaxID=3387275 RepID=UPI003F8118CE
MSKSIELKLEEIKQTRKWIENFTMYTSREVIEVEETKWYKQSDAPLVFKEKDQTFKVDLPDEKQLYLSYREPNTNFSNSPKDNFFNIHEGQRFNLNVKGKKDTEVNISIMVIFYSNGNKVEVINASFNEHKKFTIPEKVNGMRIALRITGRGNFSIHQINLNDISLWTTDQTSRNEYKYIPQTNWYFPNDQKIEYNNILNMFSINLEDEKQHLYITYNEGNSNFNTVPQNPISIKNDWLSVNFDGEKDSSLNVKLFLIFYRNKERLEVKQIDLNTKIGLKVPENCHDMRIAIRVAGKGSFSIEKISISEEGYWLTKSLNKNELLFPKCDKFFDIDSKSIMKSYGEKGKLLYHKYQNIVESTLIGQQFVYLTCFDKTELNEAPIIPVFHPEPEKYYEFYLGAQSYGEIDLTLFVMGFKGGDRQEIHQVPHNKLTKLQFKKDTTSVKVFVRVNGSGYFKDLKFGLNSKTIEITNSTDLSLKKEDWFQTGKLLEITNQNDDLVVTGKSEVTKRIYLSYKEKNNSFGIAPISHIIDIKENSIYEFLVKANVDEGMEFIPMVVCYAGDQKAQVLQLKVNAPTIIKPEHDVTDFRFAIRTAGIGTFNLESIQIKEMPIIEVNRKLNWVNNRETSILNMVKSRPLNHLKMAVIFDEFTTASYNKECELITFTPDNWLEVLTNNKPDILMVESAWYGNGGTWNKKVGYYGEENMKPLFSLLSWCNNNNIPTLFWNKEDPVHFNRFIQTAVRFDYIFTTDENMVPFYMEQAGHRNVFSLPFAAQPAIHNPIKITEIRDDKACFAGSYYRLHEERARDMDRVLDYAAKYGLDIYDRNYEKTRNGLMPNHRFPDRLTPFIKGSLKYYEIDKAYKGYKVMINVNTVKHSPTMFSRRVFEGLACGTPIVSTYAEGIEKTFGDLVYISEDEDVIDKTFNTLLNDEAVYRNKSMLGIREVLSKHTYTHRLAFICQKVGLAFYHDTPKVTVLAFAHTKEEFLHAVEQFEQQEYTNKELFILVDTFEGYIELFNQYNTRSIKTFVRTFMHNYQNILEWIDTPYLTYFSPNDYYGRNYLLDLMLCTLYTDSDFIGKGSYFKADSSNQIQEIDQHSEYEFVSSLHSARTVAKTEVFGKQSLEDFFDDIEKGTDFGKYYKFGKKLYSSDRYNYMENVKNKSGKLKKEIINQIEI